jgi:hypothetical protein
MCTRGPGIRISPTFSCTFGTSQAVYSGLRYIRGKLIFFVLSFAGCPLCIPSYPSDIREKTACEELERRIREARCRLEGLPLTEDERAENVRRRPSKTSRSFWRRGSISPLVWNCCSEPFTSGRKRVQRCASKWMAEHLSRRRRGWDLLP